MGAAGPLNQKPPHLLLRCRGSLHEPQRRICSPRVATTCHCQRRARLQFLTGYAMRSRSQVRMT